MAIASARRAGRRLSSRPSSKKANAIGFAKRRSRSVKAAVGLSDVYDFVPSKSKRGSVSLLLDKDEARSGKYDEDEDDSEIDDSRRKPRLVGEGDEDEQIASDEDEEIDSDDAFEESDEERYAGFDFKKKSLSSVPKVKKATPNKKGVRFAEVDLNESENEDAGDPKSSNEEQTNDEDEEEESGDDDEFIDVLDVLDGRGNPDFGDDDVTPGTEEKPAKDAKRISDSHENLIGQIPAGGEDESEDEESDEDGDEGEDNEDDEDDSEEDLAISASEDETEDPSALENLGNFVSGLDSSLKRKIDDESRPEDTPVAGPSKKRKRLVKDRTESTVESEFGAKARGSAKLSLEDLVAPLTSQPEALSTLKKAMKPLMSSKAKNQPLPAPLPVRTQEKLDREVAYEQTKTEISKWDDTMKQIREAEHLSFPLQAPKPARSSNLELAAKFKPTTELESSIDKLLKSAKLREEDISKTEDLMMRDLTEEEIAERRIELRKMRELAFRADAKAKRVAKIKSKAYRRIQKKSKEKLMAKLDAGADDMDPEEARLKAEVERARERATLKHKNTGKWAKAMKDRGELDEDQRRDMNEMLQRGERLRRRIQGQGSGTEDSEDDSGDDEDSADGMAKIKASAFSELDQLQTGGGEDDEDEHGAPLKAKSVFQMKFMRDAAARQSREVDRMIDDFRKELGDMEEGQNSDAEKEDDDSQTLVQRVNGRMIFRPGPQTVQSDQKNVSPAPAISEKSTLKSQDSVISSTMDEQSIPETPVSPPSSSIRDLPPNEPNPWLSLPESSDSKIAKRRNEIVVGKDSTFTQKSQNVLKKQLKKTAEVREKAKDDAIVEISADDNLTLSGHVLGRKSGRKRVKSEKKKPAGKKDKAGEKIVQSQEDDEPDSNSEVEEQEAVLNGSRTMTVFKQRDLVARAFAGDNVIQEFEEAKRKEIESDAPKEIDTTLPGWGSWGGAGTKKAPPKPNLIKKVAGVDPKSRADFGKANVIISEKRDKKAEKYTVKDLPFPYTSRAQYEMSMATPLGSEWNTRLGFQRGTLPRVVKKMGTIIDPLEKVI